MCGFGAMVAGVLLQHGVMDKGGVRFRTLHLPDRFIEHDIAYNMYESAGLNCSGIVELVQRLLGK